MTYSQGHLTAIHSTLQQHQHELKFKEKLNFSLAIDSFGLTTIS